MAKHNSKTVAILGCSYGGTRAAQILAQGLPSDWKVVAIDRNSHFNHLYVLPRMAVLSGHEHKAFVPPTGIFSVLPSSHGAKSIYLHAMIHTLSPHSLTYTRPENPSRKETLHFDYAVYALGSKLPAPIDLWGEDERTKGQVDVGGVQPVKEGSPARRKKGCKRPGRKERERMRTSLDLGRGVRDATKKGTKEEGMEYLRRWQDRIKDDSIGSVLVVGGGALGIQYASDIASIYPQKRVTLLHSRKTLLPKFGDELAAEVLSSLTTLGVHMILGERVDLSSLPSASPKPHPGPKTVRTMSGREIQADLVLLCTGQTPNTFLLHTLLPQAIVDGEDEDKDRRGLARVNRAMQVGVPPAASSHSANEGEEDEEDEQLEVPYPHLFAIGDAADAFGAIKAGHTAYWQGEVAARNIMRLIKREKEGEAEEEEEEELEAYVPGSPAIKISLGLTESAYLVSGVVGTKSGPVDCKEDLDVGLMWDFMGVMCISSNGNGALSLSFECALSKEVFKMWLSTEELLTDATLWRLAPPQGSVDRRIVLQRFDVGVCVRLFQIFFV